MIITVDGASGTGKSTVCKLVAAELGLVYVDTGAIYRCVALEAHDANISFDNEKGLKDICENLKLSFVFKDGANTVILDSQDVTEEIRDLVHRMYATVGQEVEDEFLETLNFDKLKDLCGLLKVYSIPVADMLIDSGLFDDAQVEALTI